MLAPLPSSTSSPPPHNHKKMDILKVLAEVEGGSFQVTWRECFWIGVALAFLAMCSIAVGIAAGMTISIHYYGQEIRVLPKQKATMLDPAIALTNVVMVKSNINQHQHYPMNHHQSHQQQQQQQHLASLDLGRVITTSKSGQRDMLSVVEELPPLPREQDEYSPTTSSQQQRHEPALPPIRSLLNFSQPTVLPKLCNDGVTWGFDDWHVLRKAIQEANALSAERFMKWNEYMAKYPAHHRHQYHHQRQQRQHERQQRLKKQQTQQQTQDKKRKGRGNSPTLSEMNDEDDDDEDDDMSFWYYQDEVVFTICPNVILTAGKSSPSIFINAEHVRLQCRDCLIIKRGTVLNFGRHAQDVWIRGITFAPSSKPSRIVTSNALAPMTFYQDGARANFQDCIWLNYHPHHTYTNHDNNNQIPPFSYYSWLAPTSAKVVQSPEPLWGTVADVNSSSTVNFYRCRIGVQDATSTHYPKRRQRSLFRW